MSDPLVQELRERATGFSLGDAGVALSQLLRRAADALDAAHQREQAQLFLLARIEVAMIHNDLQDVAYWRGQIDNALASVPRASHADGVRVE